MRNSGCGLGEKKAIEAVHKLLHWRNRQLEKCAGQPTSTLARCIDAIHRVRRRKSASRGTRVSRTHEVNWIGGIVRGERATLTVVRYRATNGATSLRVGRF